VDRVHGTMVHGCMRYVKLRPSKSRSTVRILKTKGLSQNLIVTIRVGFDGARLSSEKEWWHALCSQRCHGQAIRASLPRVTQHGGSGSNPKRRWWSLRLFPEAKTQRGTAPRWLTAMVDPSKLRRQRGGAPRIRTSWGWLKWVWRSYSVLNIDLVEGKVACSNAAMVRSGG
jgi:hypothetical protein